MFVLLNGRRVKYLSLFNLANMSLHLLLSHFCSWKLYRSPTVNHSLLIVRDLVDA